MVFIVNNFIDPFDDDNNLFFLVLSITEVILFDPIVGNF